VTGRFCAYCGAAVPPGGVFCPMCGGAVVAPSSGSPSPPLAGATGPYAPTSMGRSDPWARRPAGSTWATPADAMDRTRSPRDRLALARVRLAAAIGLVASTVGIASVFAVGTAIPLSATAGFPLSNSTLGATTLNFGFPWLLVVYATVGLVVIVAEYLLLWSSFRTLSPDAPEFSTPSTLALFAVVGLTVLILGALVLLYALAQASPCVTGPGMNPCFLTAGFWAGFGAIFVGGILGLIGLIGVLVGIWRLGSRYDNAMFKVAAVLLIIPYVSVAGDILLLVGAGREIRRVPGH